MTNPEIHVVVAPESGTWARVMRVAPWVIPIAWGVAFIATIVASVVAAFLAPSAAPLLTQLVASIVSAPPVLLVLAIAFGIAFKGQVAGLVERLNELSFPGGSLKVVQQSIETVAIPPPPENSKEPDVQLALTPDRDARIAQLEGEIVTRNRVTNAWYSAYLAAYLAPVTVSALRWLDTNARDKTVPWDSFTAFLQQSGVTDAAHQLNIWNALSTNYLADAHGLTVNITRRGRMFLKYLDGTWRPLEETEPTLD